MTSSTGTTRLCSGRRHALLAGSAFGLAVLGGGTSRAQPQGNPPSLAGLGLQYVALSPARPLAPATLATLAGGPVRLAHVPGRLQLIHIWASWCPACGADLLGLERFQHAQAGSGTDVTTVTLDTADPAAVIAFLGRTGVRQLKVLADPAGLVSSTNPARRTPLPAYALPITYVVTPSGLVAGYVAGAVDWSRPEAQRLLGFYAGT